LPRLERGGGPQRRLGRREREARAEGGPPADDLLDEQVSRPRLDPQRSPERVGLVADAGMDGVRGARDGAARAVRGGGGAKRVVLRQRRRSIVPAADEAGRRGLGRVLPGLEGPADVLVVAQRES